MNSSFAKIFALSAIVLGAGLSAKMVRAEAGCDVRLRQVAEVQATRDFPGKQFVINVTTPDQDILGYGCAEVRDAANPALVLAVYNELVDEECTLDGGLTLIPALKSCPGSH